MPQSDAHAQRAYVAAIHALASASVRNLLALEGDDPEVGAVMVECTAHGGVAITLLDKGHRPIGGYSL